LTRLLRESLGGNAKTLFICLIQPNMMRESKETLSFAKNASIIETHATNQPKLTPQQQRIKELEVNLAKSTQDSARREKDHNDRHELDAARIRQYQETLAQRDTPTRFLPDDGNISSLSKIFFFNSIYNYFIASISTWGSSK